MKNHFAEVVRLIKSRSSRLSLHPRYKTEEADVLLASVMALVGRVTVFVLDVSLAKSSIDIDVDSLESPFKTVWLEFKNGDQQVCLLVDDRNGSLDLVWFVSEKEGEWCLSGNAVVLNDLSARRICSTNASSMREFGVCRAAYQHFLVLVNRLDMVLRTRIQKPRTSNVYQFTDFGIDEVPTCTLQKMSELKVPGG